MIISASRRTDIPCYFSDWFYGRLKNGHVKIHNPRNHKQVREINLSPDMVTGIVFWTKNPKPMFAGLSALQNYMYYVHFTLTPYDTDIEPNLPDKYNVLVPAFKQLSDKIGAERVLWRYDPILLNDKYTYEYHVSAFDKISAALAGYTNKVTISFIDTNYRAVKRNAKELALTELADEMKIQIATDISTVAASRGMRVYSCALPQDLRHIGIEQGSCIDSGLFEKLLGCKIDVKKDKNQRPSCGCAAAVDIGEYNTCGNGCRYCYANFLK